MTRVFDPVRLRNFSMGEPQAAWLQIVATGHSCCTVDDSVHGTTKGRLGKDYMDGNCWSYLGITEAMTI